MGRNPTRAARRLTGMSSPIAFDDTQFDLDLSDHLDQFSDGPEVAPAAGGHGDLVDDQRGVDDFDGVVPVGDPWGVPADEAVPADPVPEPEPEPVAAVEAPADAATVEDVSVPWVPEGGNAAAVVGWVEAPADAATVEDVPVPWVPAEGGTATWAAAVARAVDPPTQVHSVFAVTPPQGTPAVVVPAVPPAPPVDAPQAARRRRRGVAVLAAVVAAGLVAGGAGLAIATNGGGDDGEVAVADAPGQSLALPPAGAEADKPDDAPDDAVVPPVADADEAAHADGVAPATEAVQTFLAVRGTDAERAVSSQGGRAELDAAVATIGRAVPQGAPACSAGVDAGTFTCVLDTDQGPITFTVGPDTDDPQTSGFEVIGATVG